MKPVIFSVAIPAIFSLSLLCLAEGLREPSYFSGKPLYAALFLDAQGDKVLTLVFDESAGTGKGYDTIYADLNLNGDLTDDKPIKGTFAKEGRGILGGEGRFGSSFVQCSFPSMRVCLPYAGTPQRIEKSCELNISYFQYPRRSLFGLIQRVERRFSVSAGMRLSDEAGEWRYSYSVEPGLEPVEKPGDVKPVSVVEKMIGMGVSARPDPEKEGNTGIAVKLTADGETLTCSRSNQPIKALVEIRDQEGKIVHSEDVRIDKLAFG